MDLSELLLHPSAIVLVLALVLLVPLGWWAVRHARLKEWNVLGLKFVREPSPDPLRPRGRPTPPLASRGVVAEPSRMSLSVGSSEAVRRILLSSTAADLVAHRTAVASGIERLGDLPVRMETFGARLNDPVDVRVKGARECDVLVVMVAHRYGWVPTAEQGGDGAKSITWLEVEAAKDAGKPVFAFVVDDRHPWAVAREQDRLLDAASNPAAVQEVARCVQALSDFKRWLDRDAGLTRETFTTPENLTRNVITSLAKWVRDSQPAAGGVPSEEVPDPRAYLESLDAEHQYLEIRGLGAEVAERMELREVYTRLRVAGKAARYGRGKARIDEPRAEPDLELRAVLAEHADAILIGDPGSGKTTFLRFVALNLAQARLGVGDTRTEAMSRIGLSGAPPFPVFVRLAEFATFLEQPADKQPASDDAPEHFYRFLDAWQETQDVQLTSGCLRARVREGGCFLLLDGLDEVAGHARRDRVGRIIQKVMRARRKKNNRHLVTCRSRAYQKGVKLGARIRLFKLVDFGPLQVEEFVEAWSRGLFRVGPDEQGTPEAKKAEVCRRQLLEAIGGNPNVSLLTHNPLVLTVLAVVHWSKRRLPEQRAELYDAAVENLLASRPDASPVPDTLRKECLQAVALAMVDAPGGVKRTLARAEAAKIVRPILGAEKLQAALDFLEDEELNSGIVISRSEGELEFWHLTFQEYLAALELSIRDDYWNRVKTHLDDPSWSEVLLLLAGCRRRLGRDWAAAFLTQVIEQAEGRVSRARAVALVGRMLRDIEPYGGAPEAGTGFEEALEATLGIFDPDGEEVDESIRIEVGEALGQAGDPRLDEDVWIPIDGGTFSMGAQSEDETQPGYDADAPGDDDPWRELPVHQVTVPSFQIARYPVTVQEYRGFVMAGDKGYLNESAWTPEGWGWRKEMGVLQPDDWDAQLRYPNRPVTGVSWYETDAYCRWAKVRLPTEAEWEFAARGTDGRKFPWGDELSTDRHANFSEGVANRATPVGIYPDGATPSGVQDMAGNVWEWCQDTWHESYDGAPTDGSAWDDVSGADRRVFRGGSFLGSALDCRSADRNGRPPGSRYVGLGFRPCRSP